MSAEKIKGPGYSPVAFRIPRESFKPILRARSDVIVAQRFEKERGFYTTQMPVIVRSRIERFFDALVDEPGAIKEPERKELPKKLITPHEFLQQLSYALSGLEDDPALNCILPIRLSFIKMNWLTIHAMVYENRDISDILTMLLVIYRIPAEIKSDAPLTLKKELEIFLKNYIGADFNFLEKKMHMGEFFRTIKGDAADYFAVMLPLNTFDLRIFKDNPPLDKAKSEELIRADELEINIE